MFEGLKKYLHYRRVEKDCYEILENLGELSQPNKHEVKNVIIHLKEDNPKAISYYFAFIDKFNQEYDSEVEVSLTPLEEELRKKYPVLPKNSRAIAEINRSMIELDEEVYQ